MRECVFMSVVALMYCRPKENATDLGRTGIGVCVECWVWERFSCRRVRLYARTHVMMVRNFSIDTDDDFVTQFGGVSLRGAWRTLDDDFVSLSLSLTRLSFVSSAL
jgi:hypothetical protein